MSARCTVDGALCRRPGAVCGHVSTGGWLRPTPKTWLTRLATMPNVTAGESIVVTGAIDHGDPTTPVCDLGPRRRLAARCRAREELSLKSLAAHLGAHKGGAARGPRAPSRFGRATACVDDTGPVALRACPAQRPRLSRQQRHAVLGKTAVDPVLRLAAGPSPVGATCRRYDRCCRPSPVRSGGSCSCR